MMREMKDETNSRTSPPLFLRVKANDSEKGVRSRRPNRAPDVPFRRPSVRSQSRASDSSSALSISLDTTSFSLGSRVAAESEKNMFIPLRDIASPSKATDRQISSSQGTGKSSVTVDSLDGKVTNCSDYPSRRGSLSSVTKPGSFEKNEYRFKNLGDDEQASTDLSLQLHSSSKHVVEGAAVSEGSREYMRNQSEDNAAMQSLKHETALQNEQAVSSHNHDDVSESSGMDSASGLSASPDHVVRVIRDKQCSKVRTAMIDQQRIFASQVFELHRLITVQKTLARSPNTLLEGKCHTGKPGTTKRSLLVPQMASKAKLNAKELTPASESLEKRIVPKLPLPSLSKELVHPAAAMDGQSSSPRWFSAPRNHWLVPVVSPSEGLVYKPYAGPRLQTSGLMVPVFGDDSPFETALRFPVPHQLSHRHFPPNATTRPNPFGHTTQGVPFCIRKPEASKDSEVQRSPASGPPPEERTRDVLQLFPTEPTRSVSDADEQKQHPPLRAIKAVPHNPSSASASAARIFRFIQEERKR